MVRNILAAAGIALCSALPAHAAIESHWGYTLDTDTNIFSDGTTEWLQWDVTLGMSIDEAIQEYHTAGWTLASGSDMQHLISSTIWSDYVYDEGVGSVTYTSDYGQAVDGFIGLVGSTVSSLFDGTDDYSKAFFGSDFDGDGSFNEMQVYSFVIDYALQTPDFLTDAYSATEAGVALVRSASVPELSASLAPVSLGLLAALLCLGTERRRRVQR